MPQTSANVKASIIIPVRDNLHYTRKCLASIAAARPKVPYEIVVIDNASKDGTQEFLSNLEAQGEINFIRNDPPKHFAASCNQAAKIASGRYLIFLNNDTEAFPGWLDELVDCVARSGQAGTVGAKLLYPNGTIQHAGVAFYYSELIKHIKPFHIFRHFPRYAPAVRKEREFQCLTGACLLVPRVIFEEIAGFDERFINAFEDVDLCLRLRDKGYKAFYASRAELIHYEGQTQGRKDGVLDASKLMKEKWADRFIADDRFYLEQEGFFLEEKLDGTLAICPGDELQKWNEAVEQLVNLQLYRQALVEIGKLEQIMPLSRKLSEMQGQCQLLLGDFQSAQRTFLRAQSLEADHPGPKWGLVQVALAEGKIRIARERLVRLIHDNPQDDRRMEWHRLMNRIAGSNDIPDLMGNPDN